VSIQYLQLEQSIMTSLNDEGAPIRTIVTSTAHRELHRMTLRNSNWIHHTAPLLPWLALSTTDGTSFKGIDEYLS
jgi:hypothetical protein